MKLLLILLVLLVSTNLSHARPAVDTSMYYSILDRSGTTQLDIWRGDRNDNIGLIFWNAGQPVPLNRLFRFVPAGTANQYRLVAAHSRKALTARGQGKQIVQMPLSDDSHQIVAIDDVGDGTVKLRFTASNLYFNGLGGGTGPGTAVGEWSGQQHGTNDVFRLAPYKPLAEVDLIYENELAVSLFAPFSEALKEGNLDQALAIARKVVPPERREAHDALLRIYRGDVTGGEAVLDRLAAVSNDERLFDQISTLYERREYIQRLYTPAMNEVRFKKKGMEYLEAAVRIRLRKIAYEQKITILPPVKGRWNIASGPMPGRSYHSTFASFFSYDISFPPGRFEDTFGKPVYAVADGIVVFADNDQEDNPPGVSYNSNSKANMVLVEHDTGIRSLYLHLKKGSISVVKGDRVRAGQELGSIGNSGFASGPHLHFGVSRADNFNLPVRMSGLYRQNQTTGRFELTDDPSISGGPYSDSPNLPVSNGRSYSYDSGKFVRTDGMNWHEFDDKGTPKFRFVEDRRDNGQIYLYDQKRRLMLRFPEAGGMSEYSTDQERNWTRFKPLVED